MASDAAPKDTQATKQTPRPQPENSLLRERRMTSDSDASSEDTQVKKPTPRHQPGNSVPRGGGKLIDAALEDPQVKKRTRPQPDNSSPREGGIKIDAALEDPQVKKRTRPQPEDSSPWSKRELPSPDVRLTEAQVRDTAGLRNRLLRDLPAPDPSNGEPGLITNRRSGNSAGDGANSEMADWDNAAVDQSWSRESQSPLLELSDFKAEQRQRMDENKETSCCEACCGGCSLM